MIFLYILFFIFMIKNIYCLINFSDFFLDVSKEVMLFVISFISNIVFYIIEYMVNRLFFDLY